MARKHLQVSLRKFSEQIYLCKFLSSSLPKFSSISAESRNKCTVFSHCPPTAPQNSYSNLSCQFSVVFVHVRVCSCKRECARVSLLVHVCVCEFALVSVLVSLAMHGLSCMCACMSSRVSFCDKAADVTARPLRNAVGKANKSVSGFPLCRAELAPKQSGGLMSTGGEMAGHRVAPCWPAHRCR